MTVVFSALLVTLCLQTEPVSALEPDVPGPILQQRIDQEISAKLASSMVVPAPQADDNTILRRTTLDLAGRIPTAAEAHEYVTSTDPQKRTKLVDRLLKSPDFAFHRRNTLDDLLMPGKKNPGNEWRDYLLRTVRDNRSWNDMFRDMLVGSEDDPLVKPALAFVRTRVREVDQVTNDTSVIFFGINVSCAKCHDHPLVSDWKQDHYFGMSSFFQRTYVTKKNLLAEKFAGEVKYKTTKGEDRTAKLMFLTGTVIDEPANVRTAEQRKEDDAEVKRQLQDDKAGPPPIPPFSPRAKLVELALRPENEKLLARNIVNRTWASFVGRGFVHPLDQVHSANPPSHPKLFEELADDLIAHRYDLKRLVRGIVLSETYSRSSVWSGSSESPAPELFAVGVVRPLTPRQYALSLRMASTNPKQLATQTVPEAWSGHRENLERNAEGTANQFESVGDNFQVAVDEALLFSNNEQFAEDYIRDGDDRLTGAMKTLTDRAQQIDLAYWNVFSRGATPEEATACQEYLSQRGNSPVNGLKQLTWALMTSPELRFNH